MMKAIYEALGQLDQDEPASELGGPNVIPRRARPGLACQLPINDWGSGAKTETSRIATRGEIEVQSLVSRAFDRCRCVSC